MDSTGLSALVTGHRALDGRLVVICPTAPRDARWTCPGSTSSSGSTRHARGELSQRGRSSSRRRTARSSASKSAAHSSGTARAMASWTAARIRSASRRAVAPVGGSRPAGARARRRGWRRAGPRAASPAPAQLALRDRQHQAQRGRVEHAGQPQAHAARLAPAQRHAPQELEQPLLERPGGRRDHRRRRGAPDRRRGRRSPATAAARRGRRHRSRPGARACRPPTPRPTARTRRRADQRLRRRAQQAVEHDKRDRVRAEPPRRAWDPVPRAHREHGRDGWPPSARHLDRRSGVPRPGRRRADVAARWTAAAPR